MIARFPSTCGGCSRPIAKGDPISPARTVARNGQPKTAYMHPECARKHENNRSEEASEWFC
jgi:hypothetical protein